MKYLFIASAILFFNCKKTNDKKTTETNFDIEKPISNVVEVPKLPKGALKGNFLGYKDSIYAYVSTIDTINETSLIEFEGERLPQIIIPESIGAELQLLKLKYFQKDVLLVNAKLKDTNFNEYYLFVWNDSLWKQPINRFDIHKSNMTDTLVPITNNPKDSTQLLRFYSVFEMDRNSEKKFSWKLLQESIPIEN